MKKLISILLAVAMLACFMVATVSADEVTTASISGTHVTVESGATTNLTVSTSNASFCGYVYYLSYDPAMLTVNSVTGSGVIPNIGNGSVIVTFASGENVTSHSFTINVTVNGKCGTYPISLSVDQLYAFGPNLEKVVVPYGASGASVTVNHDYKVINTVASTCEVAGYTEYECSLCGDTYKEALPLADHTPAAAVKENVVAADCVNDGSYDEVVYCSVCGDELSRKTVIVPAVGHTYGEWQYNDEIHWHECSVCGEHCDHEGEHDLYYKELPGGKPATATEPGYARFQCYCGYTWEMYLAPNPDLDPDIPPTGDITDTLTAGTAAILVTMMGTVALVVKRKTAK